MKFMNLKLLPIFLLIMFLKLNKFNLIPLMILSLIMLNWNTKMLNPFTINLLIILTTMNISLMMNITFKNNWFPLILMLVMIGGMMILFLYFNSFNMSTYKQFELNYLKTMILKLLQITFIMLILLKNQFYKINNFINLIMNFNLNKLNLNNNLFLMMFMINKFMMNKMFILMIIYLLMIMMIVTMICMNKNSSLRKI